MSNKFVVLIALVCLAWIGCFANAQPSAGDECENPFYAYIGGNDFDTTNATSSWPYPDEEQCPGAFLDWGENNPDVWFTFTTSASGSYNFTTCDSSSYDTSMVLYEDSCDNQVACNGDSSGQSGCQGYYSAIDYDLEAGKEYFIRIGGWQGITGSGTITITSNGEGDGACCVYSKGEYWCFEGSREACLKEDGDWTKGADCSSINCGGGSSWGACCVQIIGGGYECYDGKVGKDHNESICLQNDGEWTDGADCANIECPPISTPSVWYVDQYNTNPGNGTTWDSAFADVQNAMDVSSSGDQIWIAQGWYVPSDTNGTNDSREASYRLIAGVEIYGGFYGNETNIDQRQPDVHKVIFSGDLNGDDGEGGDTSDNAYHVVTAEALVGNSPILDGVYIRSGNASGPSHHVFGGGLIVYNYATGSTAYPEVRQCHFVSNEAVYGGGVATPYGPDGSACSVILTHCIFANNHASIGGGAIFTLGTGFVDVDNTLIVQNVAEQQGGAIFSGDSSLHLVNTTITQNRAGFVGGIYISLGDNEVASNTIIWDNSDSAGNNAQVYVHNGTWTSNYNCIQNYDSSQGGIGNIDLNPRFIQEVGADGVPGTGDENFGLLQHSPCIDAGDNTVVATLYDLAGIDRMLDDEYVDDTGNNPQGGPIVDMGAYEHVQGSNDVSIWTGSNSPYYDDPLNWLPKGVPHGKSTCLLDSSDFELVFGDETTSIGALYVTQGIHTVNLNGVMLSLGSEFQPLRVDPYRTGASVTFKGAQSVLRSIYPVAIDGGKIGFRDGITFSVSELLLSDRSQLSIDGTVQGNVTNDGGVVLPAGPDFGTFYIAGNLAQQGQGESTDQTVGSLAFDIGGTKGTEYDHIYVSGSADLNSSIELRWDRSFTPALGDSFDLLNVGYAYNEPTIIYNTGLPSNMSSHWTNPVSGARGSGEVIVETTGPILFETVSTYALTTTPTEIVVADLDGDNDPDIAMSVSLGEFEIGHVLILINDGMSGAVWQVTELPQIDVGMHPVDIAVIDIDGDGIANDLVVANYWSQTVSILTNDGSASFTTTEVDTDWGPKYIAVADFYTLDGASLDDLAIACDSFDITVLKNISALLGPSFEFVSSIGIAQPGDILPGDVNNDKDFDYVVLNIANNQINVLDGNGTGTFPPFTQVGTNNLSSGSNPVEMAFVDLDSDTLEDLITVNEGDGTISILLGNGTGLQVVGSGLGNASSVAVGTSPQEISVYDFDNDLDDDFVLSVVGTTSMQREIAIVRNDTPSLGSVNLSQSTNTVGSGSEPILVNHGDINQDGLEDIVSVIDLAPSVRGQNSPAVAIYFNTTEVVVDCPADIDGDGSVAVNDLLALIAAWGSADPDLDLDGSGIVDVGDLLVVIAAWGAC